jgi:glycosyltransferase involved in cell wall biosynthesis
MAEEIGSTLAVPNVERRFLVALPVRNGGEFVKICVKSILAQTGAMFRLVVFDNASTDGSVEWLRSLSDSRISICESTTALSIEENWSRIGQLESTDEYLTIIGHDDWLDKNFLFKMSALIERYPDAKLYHSQFRLVDARGTTIRRSLSGPVVELSHEFLAARLAFKRDSFGTGYVIKMKDFIDAGGLPAYSDLMFADDALWMELMTGSYKASLQEVSFAYRVHSGSTSYSPDWRIAFSALHSYLKLLVNKAKENANVRSVMTRGITDYLIFWLRWAYFSMPILERSRDEFEVQIQMLTDILEPMLGYGDESLRTLGNQALFGRFAWLRWMIWRSNRFTRSQIWR